MSPFVAYVQTAMPCTCINCELRLAPHYALHVSSITCIVGASLSEPHIDEKYMRDSYIYI